MIGKSSKTIATIAKGVIFSAFLFFFAYTSRSGSKFRGKNIIGWVIESLSYTDEEKLLHPNIIDKMGVVFTVIMVLIITLALIGSLLLFGGLGVIDDNKSGKKVIFTTKVQSFTYNEKLNITDISTTDKYLGLETLILNKAIQVNLIKGAKYRFEVAPKSLIILKMDLIKD